MIAETGESPSLRTAPRSLMMAGQKGHDMININADDLRTVAEETKDKRLGRFSAEYYQLSYDPRTGELWTDFHCSLGGNEHTVYHDEAIIPCGNLRRRYTEAELRELVELCVEEREAGVR